jgi:phosphoglycerate dehydrogenase-like enzyme
MLVACLETLRGQAPRFVIPAAALDRFDQGPLPEDHPLFALDNVVLSPHGAGLSKGAAIRMAISTARNALAALDDKLDSSMVVTARCCDRQIEQSFQS